MSSERSESLALFRRAQARLVFLALALCVCGASAQRQYCASRQAVEPTRQCFFTLAEAEEFVRTEPTPEKGYQFLAREGKPAQTLLGNFSVRYVVRPRQYDAFFGDWYIAHIPVGSTITCKQRVPLDSIVSYGCDDESELAIALLDAWPYYGSSWSTSYLGEYAPLLPPTWGATPFDETTQRAYVVVARNTLPAGQKRLLVASNQGGGSIDNRVERTDFYSCPPLFVGASPDQSMWPFVCTNYVSANITLESGQYKSLCEGNPCVPATGNKEYTEADFEWEGETFTRTYNSLGELPLLSGLGDHWAHTFSHRLLLRSNVTPDVYWLRSDGYFEAFSKVTDNTYYWRNYPGTVLYRETDEVAATHGRWRVAQGTERRLWFNEAGRLSRIEDGNRVFLLSYCTAADVGALRCPSTHELKEVLSVTGRKLSFEHEESVVASGMGAGEAVRLDARLRRIRMNGVPVAEYQYDDSGRLVKALLGDPALAQGRQYLYGEPEAICRDGLGAPVGPCNAASFANALTGVIDEAGLRYASYTYDQYVRVSGSEHAGGAGRVSLLYQASGDVIVTLPSGAVKKYEFAGGAFRKPTHVTLSSPQVGVIGTSTYTYADFRPTSQVDPAGWKTTYQYDAFRETSRTEGLTSAGGTTPQTRTIQTDWHADLNVPIQQRTYDAANVLLATTSWTYNSRGRLLVRSEHDPSATSARATTMAYCEQLDVANDRCPLVGLLKSVDGPRSDVPDITTYTYYMSDEPACAATPSTCAYRMGDLRKVINGAGEVIEYLAYDSAGRVKAFRDVAGAVNDIEYNHRGWAVAARVLVDGEVQSVMRMDYTPSGAVKRVTQHDGSHVDYDYDAAHRLIALSDSNGNRIDYMLDDAGHRIGEQTRDPAGALVTQLSRTMNALGRVQQAIGRE